MATNNNKPAAELRIGRITATIWRNRTQDDKPFYSVQLNRIFRTDDGWQRTPSFGRDDLLVVAKLADLAHTRVPELQAAAGDPADDDEAATDDA
jgi:hypothetical protein